MAEPEGTALLSGLSVVVTRPAHQAEAFCRAIEQQDGRVIRYPVLAIAQPEDLAPLLATIDQLDQFDLAIFISANAVERALNLIESRKGWPQGLKIAAVGKASAGALKRLGYPVDIFPRGQYNSEALLALESMQNVQGSRIVIFRGEGGREHLARELQQRGANVQYAECYRRTLPENYNSEVLLKAWARGEVDVVTITSGDALRNCYDMVGELGRKWLLKTPIVVVSDRVAELARELGFSSDIVVSPRADDQSMVNTLKSWWSQVKQAQN